MNKIDNILNDGSQRAKARVAAIGQVIHAGKTNTRELIAAARKASPVNRANLVEGIRWAAEKDPSFIDKPLFKFFCSSLGDKANRVAWEAARCLEIAVPLFPSLSSKAMNGLLVNTEHRGMIVRWAAAKALVSLYKHIEKSREDLQPIFEAILKRETDKGIKKIYQSSLISKIK